MIAKGDDRMKQMSKKIIKKMIWGICALLLCGSEDVHATSTNYYTEPRLYQTNDEAEYSIDEKSRVAEFEYGENSIGVFSVYGEVSQQGQYNSVPAYGVKDLLTIKYEYDGSYHGEEKDKWNLVSSDAKKAAEIELSKKIQNGVIIIQKSVDGEIWENAIEPKYNVFSKSNMEDSNIYTTTLDEIKAGTYYRVIVAYTMKRLSAVEDGVLFIKNEVYETKCFVEKYEFFVCSEQKHVKVRDVMSKQDVYSGSTIQNGFYIDKDGSSVSVYVKKDSEASKQVSDYSVFSKPGEYQIEIVTKLGKKYEHKVIVQTGMTIETMDPEVFECKKDKGFVDGTLVNGVTSYGIHSYTTIKLAQSTGYTTKKSTYGNYDAFGINGNSVSIFLQLKYSPDLLNSGWRLVNNSWGKKGKEKVLGISTGEVGLGALIIQTSRTGNEDDWVNVDNGRYASGLFTTDFGTYYSENENVLVYTPDGEEVLNGMYIRILYAYQVYNKEEKKYIDCLEKYEFYLCNNDLNAVTFHNLSLNDDIEEFFGEADTNQINVYKKAESLLNETGTVTGFTIDLNGNNTVKYTVKRDEKEVVVNADGKYTKEVKYASDGKYDIELTSAVGDTRKVTIYVDTTENRGALNTYFGEGFITGKRIYDEREYPVFEGGLTNYQICEVGENYLPISGTIKNLNSGSVIEIEASRDKREGILTEPGEYIAQFKTGFNKTEELVGDCRVFTFRFRVIGKEDVPGPIVNKKLLYEHVRYGLVNAYPVYYGITFQSAGRGYITLVFKDKQAALNYARGYADGMVEQQEDGTYRYNGYWDVRQKEKFVSGWDLADAKDYFAEQAINKGYFDFSDPFTYLTLKEETIESVENLRTLELERSVYVFAEGEEEMLANIEALPILTPKTFLYLNPGINGTVENVTHDYEFVRDKNGYDSNEVQITDVAGDVHRIEYNQGIGKQLKATDCPTGVVTITESTVYGDTNSYEAVYIQEDHNTASIDLKCYDNDGERIITLGAIDNGIKLELDAFQIESIRDELDPYSLVIVSLDGKEKEFCCADQLTNTVFIEAGNYHVKVVNRLGYSFSFEISVAEAKYSLISFTDEGVEGLDKILVQTSERIVNLPQVDKLGYELEGYVKVEEAEENKAFRIKLDEADAGKVICMEPIWKIKRIQYEIQGKDGNILKQDEADYGTYIDLTQFKAVQGYENISWYKNGEAIVGDKVLIDSENKILITSMSEKLITEDATEENVVIQYEEQNNHTLYWILGVFLLVVGCVSVVLMVFIRRKKCQKL